MDEFQLPREDTSNGKRYSCPCCGHFTLTEEPTGRDAICPVCYWQDDYVQFHDPSYWGGANEPSLNDARRNFHAFGASERRFISRVRPPKLDELPPSPTQ